MQICVKYSIVANERNIFVICILEVRWDGLDTVYGSDAFSPLLPFLRSTRLCWASVWKVGRFMSQTTSLLMTLFLKGLWSHPGKQSSPGLQ